MKLRIVALIPLFFGLAEIRAAEENGFSVRGLRCEYLENPLGIDVEKPRLSWQLSPGPRGQRQTAYHILVASSLDKLRNDQGDLWDSGKVDSDQSVFVEYAGRPLTSGERCCWKARAWDKDGQPSPWSAPGLWSMGLLRPSDWTGQYIGLGRPANVKEGTPLPFPWLRKTIELKEKPRRAFAYVNPLGYYE
ncbi:MAG: hypothetical protein ACP5XB_14305, partial [Isosphaeraceae bacterium]